MGNEDKLVYSTLIRKIDEYIINHSSKPTKAIMNKATNKKLVEDIHGSNNQTVISIKIVFGIYIVIKEKYQKRELYNNEIIVLSK